MVVALPAQSGVITELTDVSGAGIVLIDTDEGTQPPGIQAITLDPNNDDFTSGNGFSPQGVVNCLMASNPDLACDSPPGSGKRFKTFLQGGGPLDMVFGVEESGGVTEVFSFGKTTNDTGARVLGFQLILGTGTGEDFEVVDEGTNVLFDNLSEPQEGRAADWPGNGGVDGQNPLQRAFFPGGLFGTGGQEGEIGFFDGESAGMVFVSNDGRTILTASDLFNDQHLALFGDGLISRNTIPDGFFWDDNDNPDDESALVAWFDQRAGAWIYGNVGVPGAEDPEEELSVRLASLAAALGVDEADLQFAAGDPVPQAIIDLMQADTALFEVAGIEDLSNLNLNFSIDVGDIPAGEFTLRLLPSFAPIVEEAGTQYQFAVAGSLDAAANIPFLDGDEDFQHVIDEIMYLGSTAERQVALERSGFSFLGAFSGLAYALGSDQIFAFGRDGQSNGGTPGDTTRSSKNGNRQALSDTTDLFVSIAASYGDQDRTVSNAGYDYTTYSVNAGVETRITPNVSAGVMLGYGDAESDIDDGRGELDADGWTAAAFLRLRAGTGGLLQAVAGYQDLSFDSERHIRFGAIDETATGDTDGEIFFGALDAEWMFGQGGTRFGPMASVELYSVSVDGFTESGAGVFNTSVADLDDDIFVARAGLRGEHRFATTGGGGRVYGHAAYADRSGDDMTVATAFDGGAVPAFSTPVSGFDDQWLDLGAGVSVDVARLFGAGARIGAEYRGAIFGGDTESHRGRLFLSFAF